MTGRAPLSATRVGWIARNTMREAVRQRVFVFVVLLAIAMVASAVGLREFNFGVSELKFLADFGFGALTFFGSLLAVVVTAQLFFGEIENRTVQTMLAKPVLRAEFLLGKFAGVWFVLLCFCGVVGAVLLGVLWIREGALLQAQASDETVRGALVNYGGVIAFVLLQWLKLGVIAGFTMLISSYAQTSLFAMFSSFLVLVICHLQYLAHDAWERAAGMVARTAGALLALLFPNFQVFNIGDRIAGGGEVSVELVLRVSAYACAYIAVALTLAAFVFRRREV